MTGLSPGAWNKGLPAQIAAPRKSLGGQILPAFGKMNLPMPGEARLIANAMTTEEIGQLAEETFGDMIKLAVDVERGVVAAGGMLHADGEALLLGDGSAQRNIWARIISQKGRPVPGWIIRP